MPLIIAAAAALCIVVYLVSSVMRLRENSAAMGQTSRELLTRLQTLESRSADAERAIKDGFEAMRREQKEDARAGREEQSRGMTELGNNQAKRVKEIGDMQRESLDAFSRQLTNISKLDQEKLEAMRATMEQKLEKMRETVDEELHSTLEKRLGEAFKTVSDNLEQVHKGLGEMKALSADVGDIRKVLTNVKVRGTWGEMQLRTLLDQILTKDQYAENVVTRPGSSERVEFAVKLPGRGDGDRPVYLPIDSKFPLEDYQRLVSASERCAQQEIDEAKAAIKTRVVAEARDISAKYLESPYTTDFGILYLPVEGLYAEVLRIDGLCEKMAREYKVIPAGPTTIAALLNSLQMGFRTLAIEKRSDEVWTLLGRVRTEFDKFGDVLDKTKLKIEQAGRELENAGVRSRAITKALRNVQKLPAEDEAEDAEEPEKN